jgi:hypothetical protein
VNKKKQKNFANLGRAGFGATGLKSKKFLEPLFSKDGHFLHFCLVWKFNGAGEGIRTLDPNLGKVVLYP